MTTAAEIQAKMDLLSANMDRLDGITNGGPADTVSTTGGSVPSWAKFLADRELDAAYIAAMAAAGLYASEAAGLAATTDGDYFLVKGSGSIFASLFLNDSGSAVSQDLDIPSAYNPNLNEPEGRDLLNHYWPCDEGQGTILKDVIGGVEIDTTDASLSGNNSGGSVTWDREGVLTLNNAWFGTPSTVAARTLFLVYEVPLRKSVWVMTHPRNGDSLITSTYNQSVTRLRNISGPGIKDLHHRTSDGQLGTGMALGGITGIWVEKAAQQTGSIFFNSGREDGSGASAQTYRLLCVATASGTLTLEQVKKVRLFLARQLAKRGQYMIPEVCPKQCAVAVWSGESTHHTNLTMDNDPTLSGDTSLRKRAYTNTFLTGVDDPIGDGEVNRPFEQLTYWMDQTDESGYQIGNEGVSGNRARKMGPLRGFAERHLYAANKFRAPLFHMKLAVGGTRIAPVGTVDADAGTVSVAESRSPATGGRSLFPNVLLQGFLQYEAELRRMGYGIRHVHDFRAEGINDAFYLSLSVLTSSSVYQAWLQDEHDDKKAYLGIDPFPTAILVPHLPVPGAAETEVAQLGFVGGYTDDATGQRRLTALLRIRQACRDFATANSDVTAFEGDDYELNTANGDSVHPSLQGLTDMGADYRLAYDFTTAFTEAFDG